MLQELPKDKIKSIISNLPGNGKLLYDMAVKYHKEAIAEFIKKNLPPRPLLLIAIANKDAEGIERALKLGADPNHEIKSGTSIFLEAVKQKLPDNLLKIMINHGASVDHPFEKGTSALYNACNIDIDEEPDIKFVKKLLDLGADVNKVDTQTLESPLMSAVFQHHQKLISLLLEHGANVNHQSKNGETALSLAMMTDVEDLKVLLDKGADPNHVNNLKESTLIKFAKNSFGVTDTAELLLQYGARLELKDSDGKTALDIAREAGNTALVQCLEAAELKVNDELKPNEKRKRKHHAVKPRTALKFSKTAATKTAETEKSKPGEIQDENNKPKRPST